jgi:tetratricopeptide (TPR) repeat protein
VNTPRFPRSYYLARAIACYERIGDTHSIATLLAQHGHPADAASYFEQSGDWQQAGEMFLAAGDAHQARRFFQQAGDSEGELRCLIALGLYTQAAIVLLDTLHRPAEAVELLERGAALLSPDAPVAERVLIGLLLASSQLAGGMSERAWETERRVAPLLKSLPATRAYQAHTEHDIHIEAWIALGRWGHYAHQSNRMQEGYAQALRLIDEVAEAAWWRDIAHRYQAAARVCGNRRLAQRLETALASYETRHANHQK